MLCTSSASSRIFYVCHDSLDLKAFVYITQDGVQDILHRHVFQPKKKVKLPPPGLYRPTNVHTFMFTDLGLCACLHTHACGQAIYTCFHLRGCAHASPPPHRYTWSVLCVRSPRHSSEDRHPPRLEDQAVTHHGWNRCPKTQLQHHHHQQGQRCPQTPGTPDPGGPR